MRNQKQKQNDANAAAGKGTLPSSEDQSPILVSARTGLAGKDDAILRRVPVDYSGKTVKSTLNYVIGEDVSDSELPLAESIRKELNARGSVVVINGKTAKLNDKLDQYLVTKEHELPDGSKKQYRELEIEVSAVQQGGGLYNLLR